MGTPKSTTYVLTRVKGLQRDPITGRIVGHKPTLQTRKIVRMMIAAGIKPIAIADGLEIDHRTLAQHYSYELANANADATLRVADSLFRMATDTVKPNVVAAIFWLKCRAGWREDAVDEASRNPAQLAHTLREEMVKLESGVKPVKPKLPSSNTVAVEGPKSVH